MRCFSCGKVSPSTRKHPARDNKLTICAQVVGDLWTKYIKLIDPDQGESFTEGYAI